MDRKGEKKPTSAHMVTGGAGGLVAGVRPMAAAPGTASGVRRVGPVRMEKVGGDNSMDGTPTWYNGPCTGTQV